jgi:hypothetical protein
MSSIRAANASWKASNAVGMLAFSSFLNRLRHTHVQRVELFSSIFNKGMKEDSMYIPTYECALFKVIERQSSTKVSQASH